MPAVGVEKVNLTGEVVNTIDSRTNIRQIPSMQRQDDMLKAGDVVGHRAEGLGEGMDFLLIPRELVWRPHVREWFVGCSLYETAILVESTRARAVRIGHEYFRPLARGIHTREGGSPDDTEEKLTITLNDIEGGSWGCIYTPAT